MRYRTARDLVGGGQAAPWQHALALHTDAMGTYLRLSRIMVHSPNVVFSHRVTATWCPLPCPSVTAASAKCQRRGAASPGLDVAASWSGDAAGGGPGSPSRGGGGSGGLMTPWEAVVDARPATRYASLVPRDAASLQLLLPSGGSHESVAAYEQQLLTHIAPGSVVAGSAAAAAAVGGAGAGGAAGVGHTAALRRSTSPNSWAPGSPSRRSAGGYRSTVDGDASAPASPPVDSRGGGGGPGLPPLAPRSALSTALAAPAPAAQPPWGGAGLPAGVHASAAERAGGAAAAAAAGGGTLFSVPGTPLAPPPTPGTPGTHHPPPTANGNANGGAINPLTDEYDEWGVPQAASAPALTLSRLIMGRPSNRRQVQLMAEWFDSTIGGLWEQHVEQQQQKLAETGGYVRPASAGPGPWPTVLAGAWPAGPELADGDANVASPAPHSPPSNAVPLPTMAGPASAHADAPASPSSAMHATTTLSSTGQRTTCRLGATAPATAAASTAAAAGGGGTGGGGGGLDPKALLAARFGSISAGLRELSASLYGSMAGVAAKPQLWAAMVEVRSCVWPKHKQRRLAGGRGASLHTCSLLLPLYPWTNHRRVAGAIPEAPEHD